MTTRTITLLFVALILFIATGFIVAWYFLFANQSVFNPGGGTAQEDPFGFLGGQYDEDLESETPTEEPIVEEEQIPQEAPRLKRLTSVPVAGAIATTTKDGVFARYIERGTGNVYDINLETGGSVRVTNTTIRSIQEATWMPNADHVIIRYFDENLEEVETYLGSIKKNTQSSSSSPQFILDGSYLAKGIPFITPSPTTASIAFVTDTASGVSMTTSRIDGSQKKIIASLPMREVLIDWPTRDTLVITTKPSSGVPGYAYSMSTSGGSLERLMEPKYGLQTLLSPDGSLALFSEAADQQIFTGIVNRKSKKQISLSLNALAEKCTWGTLSSQKAYCGAPRELENSDYPDSWHMGLVSFSDFIWEINTSDGTATLLEVPDAIAPSGIDMIDLSVSKNDDYLLFINKKDGFLWSYDLN